VQGEPLPFESTLRLEMLMPEPPQAPCEGGTRTRQEPEGWGE